MQTSALSAPRSHFGGYARRIATALLIGALIFAGLWGMRGNVAAQEIEEPGILIVRVAPGSPAAEAGLRRGNILLTVDGEAVNTVPELMAALAQKAAGDEIELTFLHGDDEKSATVTLADADGRVLLGIVPFVEGGSFRFEGVPMQDDGLPALPIFSSEGAMIVEILEGSAAAEAGLQVGDLILSVDGDRIADGAALVDAIAGYAPGDTVTLEVSTGDDDPRTVEVTLGAREDDAERAFLGVQVGPPSFERMDPESMPFRFEMPFHGGAIQAMEGVLIHEVAEGSPAADAGLRAGDLITEVDGEAVASFEELRDLIANAAPGDELTLTVRSLGLGMFRGDEQPADQEPRTVTVTLGENEDGNAFLGISAAPMRLRIQEGTPRNFTFPRPDRDGEQGMAPHPFFHGLPLREDVERFFREMPGWDRGRSNQADPAPAQPALPSTEL